MIARRFRVRGRVQGVGFRYFVLDAAHRLGLAGWTRNLPDGGVEVMAQGERAALELLAADLAMGPPAAWVEAVEAEEAPIDTQLAGFGVRY